MRRPVEAAYREELRHAGLPSRGALAHLLALLRASPDTHLAVPDVARMAAHSGLAAAPEDIGRQLETLADHCLLARMPGRDHDPMFDTVPQPHSHLVFEDPVQIVDLDVSPETLLAILQRLLAERPGGVEIVVRCRAHPAQTPPEGSGREPTP
jgi:Fur family iron response transcriptional regulator